eukprot:1670267-Rhodomonas_salina.1
MEGFWEYLFLFELVGVILIAAESVRITTIVTTFLTGYALGVASIIGAIYYLLLIRFQLDIFDPETHNLVCSQPA